MRRGIPRDELEDLVQEAFLRVYASRTSRPLRRPKSFLFATAKNLLIDRQRRRFVRGTQLPVVDPHRAASPEIDPEERASLSERTELLWLAIGQLPPRCRTAFVLRKFHHLSYRAIAKQMGISVKTVEKHLARAVLKCREYLQEAERSSSRVVELERYRRDRRAAQ